MLRMIQFNIQNYFQEFIMTLILRKPEQPNCTLMKSTINLRNLFAHVCRYNGLSDKGMY